MSNNEEKLKELKSLEERISQLKSELELPKSVTLSMEELYNTFTNKTDFTNHLYKMKMLNTETIRECSRLLDWSFLESHYTFSLDEMCEFERSISFGHLSINSYNNLSLELIRKKIGVLDWNRMSYIKLTNEFITEFSDKLNWITVSLNAKLSEEMIERYSDKVNWSHITLSQDLSEEFIIKHCDKLDPRFITFHKPSKETLELFKERMDLLDKEIEEKQKNYKPSYIETSDEEKLFYEEWMQSYSGSLRIEGSGKFDRLELTNGWVTKETLFKSLDILESNMSKLDELEKESIDDQTDFQSGSEEEEEVLRKEEDND